MSSTFYESANIADSLRSPLARSLSGDQTLDSPANGQIPPNSLAGTLAFNRRGFGNEVYQTASA
jgi:hypothetical protein